MNLHDTQSQITKPEPNQWVLLQQSLQADFEPQWFDQHYWLNQGRLLGANSGRGSAWTIKSEHGKWVLRHYYRGGLVGRLIRDSYAWIGLQRSRAFREFAMLQQLQNLDLPAPRPVAARVIRKGLLYSNDLLMSHIPHEMTFARMILDREGGVDAWRRIGHTIARFHQQGIYHSDLNAHNILLDQDQVHLIDFDKARQMKKPGQWQEQNLSRLQRSIHKVSDLSCEVELKTQWQALLKAYHAL